MKAHPERDAQQAIQIAVSQSGARVWRNNVGTFYTKDGRPVRCGLAPGSSDLIGITPVVVTPDMVGRTLGIFTALEVKAKSGRASVEQINFIGTIRRLGGIAGQVRTVAEAAYLQGTAGQG